MVDCRLRQPEDHRVRRIPVARRARVRVEMQDEAGCKVRLEGSSDKEDWADKPEERWAEAEIRSQPEMTAPIHSPM